MSRIENLIEQFPMLKKQFKMWELVVRLTHPPYSFLSLTTFLFNSIHWLPFAPKYFYSLKQHYDIKFSIRSLSKVL